MSDREIMIAKYGKSRAYKIYEKERKKELEEWNKKHIKSNAKKG